MSNGLGIDLDEVIADARESGNLGAIDQMIFELQKARNDIALDSLDTDAIMSKAFSESFTAAGVGKGALVLPKGLIALPGTVQDTTSKKHKCSLYTVRMELDASGEWWQWEEAPSFIASESVKVDKLRRTVSIHSMPSDSLIIQHNRTHDGMKHTSVSVKAFFVDHKFTKDGELKSTRLIPASASVVRKLPRPEESIW